MAGKFTCSMCEKPEMQCDCQIRDYCCLCLGSDDIRLCEDGQYYCRICREACDYSIQNPI